MKNIIKEVAKANRTTEQEVKNEMRIAIKAKAMGPQADYRFLESGSRLCQKARGSRHVYNGRCGQVLNRWFE